eukprot:4027709-Pyramimonas_sp.AAC.1
MDTKRSDWHYTSSNDSAEIQVAGGKARGMRLATTLAVGTWTGGPGIAARVAGIKEWVNMWQRCPEMHPRVVKARPVIRARLVKLGPKRWRGACGPAGAVQVTFLDVGWYAPRQLRGLGQSAKMMI